MTKKKTYRFQVPEAMEKMSLMQKRFESCIPPATRNALETASRIGQMLYEKMEPIRQLWEPFRQLSLVSYKFADNQFVIWEYLDRATACDFLEAGDTDDWLLSWCEANDSARIKESIDLCAGAPRIEPYSILFSQSILAYKSELFPLCILGLLSMVDGLLSDLSEMHGTAIKKRAETIFDQKIENSGDLSVEEIGYLSFSLTFGKMYETISESKGFEEEEPDLLNRHWIMHGRSRRTITKLDCIKIIRFIHALILLDEIGSDGMKEGQPKESNQ